MGELYLISVLGYLKDISLALLIISSVATVMLFGLRFYAEDDEELCKTKRLLKVTCTASIVSIFLYIFVPSKSDLYVIYGVGQTIDYIKENREAKNIPTKVISFIDNVIDDYNNKNK